ncbi:MAG: electron-transfer flavoprotein:ubiquinone oxidoreductase [Sulfurospirillaceae bacterium]|nr:electron-transfer flavoprotein:ubiquinone oxidoreductase [Sulfurospirillaceae bacterium]MDD2827893.1 electron-transfer flavoprotein:ubiquinone oxidoreductase [Sulfurospirillaceae bacterium]
MDNTNTLTTDIIIVGAGPAGLSAAIHLADEFKKIGIKKRIMVIEKGNAVGAHILSGAIIKADAFKELLSAEEFNALPFDSEVTHDTTFKLSENGALALPFHPPVMDNIGYQIASLGQICKYLATLAEARGVEIYTSFSVNELLYENDKVVGIKTIDTGVNHHGEKQKNYQEGTRVYASLIILAEGTRGSLAKELKTKFDLRKGVEPQVYSLGIKELWSVPEGNIQAGEVYHTFGYPLESEFGGGFVYGLKDNKVAVGFAVGLDYEDPSFDIYKAMQVWKQHPRIAALLKEGTLLEFGAKTIPEGGWDAISKLYVDNVLLVGDSAGFVAMPALKGIHLAVTSGMCAAKTAALALVKKDTSEVTLAQYKTLIDQSRIRTEMYPYRNFRAVMSEGIFVGGLKFGIQLLTNGACLFTPKLKRDNLTLKRLLSFRGTPFAKRFKGKLDVDKKLTFNKVTSVFYSGTQHDEVQLVHLHVKNNYEFIELNMKQYGTPCQHFCPAEVYEEHRDKEGKLSLKIHAENCVHCKTCDIKAPNDAITWMTPYGGDGPQYQNM